MPAAHTRSRTHRAHILYLFSSTGFTQQQKTTTSINTHHSDTESSVTTNKKTIKIVLSSARAASANCVPRSSSLRPPDFLQKRGKRRSERNTQKSADCDTKITLGFCTAQTSCNDRWMFIGIPQRTRGSSFRLAVVNLTTSRLSVALATCRECLAACPRNSRSTTFRR